jgi:hypothetical protein
MWKSCGFPVQITAVIEQFSLPARPHRFKIRGRRSLAFLQPKPEVFDFQETRTVFPGP